MAKCKSCGAAITWIKDRNHKWHPIDAEPSEKGNLRQHSYHVEILSRDAAAVARAAGESLYISHFATCPNAALHRR